MKKLAIAFVISGAAALAACNKQDQPAPPPPPAPSTPSNPTPTPAPTPAATADGGTAAAAPAGADGGTAAAGTATAAATDPKAEADQIFSQRCSVCHGMDGKGDGPGAAALNPKPRNYTDPTWQASVTDEHIAKTIVEGGAAVGKSPLMAPNPDLKDKPEVVKALVAKIRSFKGK